ncbi:MAG: ABC transporter substrate-binding protein [Methylocystis sp.]|jgi:putative hydroxymethylpyrimidine transport system substrate-binding protein|nr:ABC transporter substrate-binding protein [Methylocystis sp.]MCA3583470.1 ABC transporter substrate-binding protein [Methylocystis sp.]MCA3587432.1 ABC transporter substrate-binding protein [Methylocystis sp.]MCA3592765.1 ABC transporter substrate-binding protein [Methylocystis sp.]
MTRRLFTALLLALSCLAPPAAMAQQPEKLTLLLDWFVNPDHAPIIIAKERGLFARRGLDVQIVEPSDPSAPPRLIAAGQGDIAISYQPSFTRAVKSGIPVVRIGTLVATPLNTLTVLSDGPVKTLADLKGRTIGYSGSGIHDMMLKTMLKSVGLTEADVKLVNVNFALTAALVSGRADAIIGGFRNFEGTEIELAGKKPKMFFPEEHGVPAYDELIYVVKQERFDDPRFDRFFAAIEEATMMILNDPQGTWATFIKAYPKLDDTLNRKAWMDTMPRFQASPRAVDPARYLAVAEFMRQAGIIDKVEPIERYIGKR